MELTISDRGSRSDTGLSRAMNEDAVFEGQCLFVVADGIGGHRAGEVASTIACDAIRSSGTRIEGDPAASLAAWLDEANMAVYQAANADPELNGMGTTAVAAFVGDGVVAIGHVGDSRAYRVRAGSLERLTSDHTFVGELLEGGVLTAEQAATHPARGQLLRALGRRPDVSPAIAVHDVVDGDLFLLCSDGLTGMISEAELAAFLALPVPLHDIADRLVEAANAGGGKDNITVALFRLAVDHGRAQTTVTNRIIR